MMFFWWTKVFFFPLPLALLLSTSAKKNQQRRFGALCILEVVRENFQMVFIIEKLQDILSYEGCTNFQFRGNGIGKIGTSGFLLGFVGGNRLDRMILILQRQSLIMTHIVHIILSLQNRDAHELYTALCFASIYSWATVPPDGIITTYIGTLVTLHGFSLHISFFGVFLNSCFPAIATVIRM